MPIREAASKGSSGGNIPHERITCDQLPCDGTGKEGEGSMNDEHSVAVLIDIIYFQETEDRLCKMAALAAMVDEDERTNDRRTEVVAKVAENCLYSIAKVTGCEWMGRNAEDTIHQERILLGDVGLGDLDDSVLTHKSHPVLDFGCALRRVAWQNIGL